MNKIIVITGPTASGKSSLAIKLAKLINAEIISADSMQIYKYMSVGTAKATPKEQATIKHHMIDIVEPCSEYSVSKYVEDAYKCIEDIESRNKKVIVCGGTGLYIDSLIRGNDFMGKTEGNPTREKLNKELEIIGAEAMHLRLKDVDIESYERLHPNDTKRVIRALEVYEDFGMTISKHNEYTKSKADKLNSIFFCLNPIPREFLYDRINQRVDIMVKEGLIEETKELLDKGYLVNTAAQAIGYKEILGYINNENSLEEAIELLKQKTRNYAKRQLTWFRKKENIHWLDYEKNTDSDNLIQIMTKILQSEGVEL